jgi:hypothetical protein
MPVLHAFCQAVQATCVQAHHIVMQGGVCEVGTTSSMGQLAAAVAVCGRQGACPTQPAPLGGPARQCAPRRPDAATAWAHARHPLPAPLQEEDFNVATQGLPVELLEAGPENEKCLALLSKAIDVVQVGAAAAGTASRWVSCRWGLRQQALQ